MFSGPFVEGWAVLSYLFFKSVFFKWKQLDQIPVTEFGIHYNSLMRKKEVFLRLFP